RYFLQQKYDNNFHATAAFFASIVRFELATGSPHNSSVLSILPQVRKELKSSKTMGQQSLIYCFVSRGTVILAEHTEFSGNFASIAYQCLEKLPTTNNKFTYSCDRHTFNYLVEDGFTYGVVAEESFGQQVPMAFLERIKDDFKKRYSGGRAEIAIANSLKKEFGPKLKEHMDYCVEHPEEISKVSRVKAQVAEVKGVMMENIDKVIEREVKLSVLVDKTDNLRFQ
ncbi:hypothetical protein KI387_007648, partial [Taxus chinensis]